MSSAERDLNDYTLQYRALPFEPIQAAYRRQRVLAQIALHRPRRLLEVGCGDLPLFTDLPGIEVTVVEPAAAFAQGARRLAEGRADVHVIEAGLEAAAATLAPFDMIVIGCLLHEVDDPQALLAAARRLCTATTLLHVNVPNAASLHRLLAVAMGLIDAPGALSSTQRTMQQRGTYDRAALDAELAKAGFKVVDAGSLFVKPFTHAQMQRLVDTGFMTPALLDGLDRLAHTLPNLGSELWLDARRCDE
ncbi:MAG: methyltransferase [Burkholderiales bacterium]